MEYDVYRTIHNVVDIPDDEPCPIDYLNYHGWPSLLDGDEIYDDCIVEPSGV